MSYRLINANNLNGKISEKDYEVVLNAPCIYTDLPKGLDGRYYGLTKREKKGEWICSSDYPDRLICNKCNAQFDMWHWEKNQMLFCPHCGADMRGEKDAT